MNLEFVSEYINQKLAKNESYIVFTFFELRVKCNLTEWEIEKFLELSKNKLENNNYKVYFSGEKFLYENEIRTVPENELMIAIYNSNKKRGRK